MPSAEVGVCPDSSDLENWEYPDVVTAAWPEPEFTRGQVDKAGDRLAQTDPDDLFMPVHWNDTVAVINNWRSSHSYPLQVMKMTLLKRAQSVAQAKKSKAIVAQRLKRLESIWTKLRLPKSGKLSQMQDIGGCRAVMRSAAQVAELVSLYEAKIAKPPSHGPTFHKRYDYIEKPKPSGYRSVHYVYKYRSGGAHQCFNDLRIEIQIRSQLQHAWATAVETVSALTKQALKSNIGSDQWKRFFALMGTAIALREKTPIVPGTPSKKSELYAELRECAAALKVQDILNGYGYAVFGLTGQEKDAETFLLVLDPVDKTIDVIAFGKNQLSAAENQYLEKEKELDRDKGMQAVLVSAESVSALRRAYPNYFLDTRAFIDALTRAIAK